MTRQIIPEAIAREPWHVILPLLLLNTFGSAILYSAAGGNLEPWATLHTIHFAVFLAMALVISHFSRDFLKLVAFPGYVVLVLLLVLVELIGGIGGGSQRWLNLGFMTLQPSELMKPGIVLMLARYYDTLPPAMTKSWRSLLPAAGLLGVPTLLVMLQPDLGTALSISAGAVVVIFLAGLPLRWFIGAGAAAIAIIPVAFYTLLHDYQRNRVLTFLDPESDPLGTGYHISQSKIAIGSGGFFGKGFGNGSQSHLEYLPEAHTDFAFATMAEEWGFVGGLFILGVFMWILRWGLQVARNAPDRFSMLLAAGMTFTIFFYMAVNVMMVMGLAPVVGIPLPWISHGGSSLMTNMICIGTIMAVERWSKRSSGLSG
ncbi:rod shape-determining protein RodA [Novosphingobium sp.]|uniref:rod shape-determining protein RodA n=1 Tax=Novosphingobium sp. TaxID=1874826 RepID=UPI0027368273|nr:rod shape-determining protein RodA [Novosphingobium sp.]MDP3905951.1 rod shape-determining protein RodA [Novosphingobium sp.]